MVDVDNQCNRGISTIQVSKSYYPTNHLWIWNWIIIGLFVIHIDKVDRQILIIHTIFSINSIMSYDEEEYIDRFFDRKHFNIRKDDDEIIFIEDKNNKLCLEIMILEEIIFILNLSKCDAGRGPELLNKMFQLSKLLKKPIHLTDASAIKKCGIYIRLRCLHILSYGISWYNTFGFKSENQEEIDEINRRIIHQPLRTFLDSIIRKSQEIYDTSIRNVSSKEREKLLNESEKNISMIEEIREKYIDFMDDTTEHFFLYCTNHIFKSDDCDQIRYLNWLLEYIIKIKAIEIGDVLVRPYDEFKGGSNKYLKYFKKSKRRCKRNTKRRILSKRKRANTYKR